MQKKKKKCLIDNVSYADSSPAQMKRLQTGWPGILWVGRCYTDRMFSFIYLFIFLNLTLSAHLWAIKNLVTVELHFNIHQSIT